MFALRGQAVQPPLVLAPMMDLTGYAFRSLVRSYGGCGLFYSEMLNARRVPRESEAAPIYKGFGREASLVLQLLGNEPEVMAGAIRRLETFQPLGFDLNLGCSRALIMKRGWGAAMLGDPAGTRQVVRAMRQATSRSLTVKVRNAWTRAEAAWEFMRMLEDEGVDALVVHPRTPEKRFARPAQWEWIAEVKSRVSIPVVGNGDVATAADVLEMMRRTGCDGVMIGRAAAAHPAIFREAAALLLGQEAPPAPPSADVFETLVAGFEGELHLAKRAAELKTFCEYFAEALPVPHWFWGPLQSLREAEAIIAKVRAYFRKAEQK
ncbi:MAG: tRNA-dihydrouridine synthase family protein [candidate division FCPU426 bacterium]